MEHDIELLLQIWKELRPHILSGDRTEAAEDFMHIRNRSPPPSPQRNTCPSVPIHREIQYIAIKCGKNSSVDNLTYIAGVNSISNSISSSICSM